MQSKMDVNTVFEKVRQQFSKSPIKEELNTHIDAVEQFIEDQCYDFDYVTTETRELKKEYLSRQNHSNKAIINSVFTKITKIINTLRYASRALVVKRLYNKSDLFTKMVDFNPSCIPSQLDRYIPHEYRLLKPLERVSMNSTKPISEYLVTCYHQSNLSINQYIAQNVLFDELQQKHEQSPHTAKICIPHNIMNNYLIEYENAVSKPLPHDVDAKININKYSDDITVIMHYIAAINNGINCILSGKASYPLQLDVFFVAPYKELDLHSLDGLHGIISDHDSRGNESGVGDVYPLLRTAAQDMIMKEDLEFNQRFIMLIDRCNVDDSFDDRIYIYKPSNNNTIPPSVISDNVELTYLLNSKSSIVDGLLSTDEGVLGLTHHLHAVDCNKVYLSYGNYKSRVFKHDILKRLQILFDPENDRRHIIEDNCRIEFNQYQDFTDDLFATYGEYWFNNEKAYECYKPSWNQPSRANTNVFIPKHFPSSCTEDLNEYIDESFETAQELYYNLDYTLGMQMIDQQTVYLKWSNGKAICLINTELHRNRNVLYAVIVENNFKSKQKWKIIDYEHISQAFMTKDGLMQKYKLFNMDIPKGTKAKHDFRESKDRIKVTKSLIRNTNWPSIRIVQSKQNVQRLSISRNGNKKRKQRNNDNGAEEISDKRFRVLALQSLQKHISNNIALTHIVQFEFGNNRYHLEKLLPVHIPECNKYVAISFLYKKSGTQKRTEASGVCLDLVDMKNKASLIDVVPLDSWLNKNEDMTINNLRISPNRKYTKKGSRNLHQQKVQGMDAVQPSASYDNNMVYNNHYNIQTLPQQIPQSLYPHVVHINTQQRQQTPIILPTMPQLLPSLSMPVYVQILQPNTQQYVVQTVAAAQQQAQYFGNIYQQNCFNVNTVNTASNTVITPAAHYDFIRNYSMPQNPP